MNCSYLYCKHTLYSSDKGPNADICTYCIKAYNQSFPNSLYKHFPIVLIFLVPCLLIYLLDSLKSACHVVNFRTLTAGLVQGQEVRCEEFTSPTFASRSLLLLHLVRREAIWQSLAIFPHLSLPIRATRCAPHHTASGIRPLLMLFLLCAASLNKIGSVAYTWSVL